MSEQLQQLQELVTRQQAEIQQLRATGERAAVAAAVDAGLDASGFEFASPAARGQAAELLRAEINLVSAGGQTIAAGPGLASAADHIKSRLGSESFAHFRRNPTLSPAAPGGGGRQPAAEPTTLGAAMIQQALASRPQAASGDPRMNMTLPIG